MKTIEIPWKSMKFHENSMKNIWNINKTNRIQRWVHEKPLEAGRKAQAIVMPISKKKKNFFHSKKYHLKNKTRFNVLWVSLFFVYKLYRKLSKQTHVLNTHKKAYI